MLLPGSERIKRIKTAVDYFRKQYQDLSLKFGHIFEAGIGAEAIRKLLEAIDLDLSIKKLRQELAGAIDTKREKIMRRLKLLKSLQ